MMFEKDFPGLKKLSVGLPLSLTSAIGGSYGIQYWVTTKNIQEHCLDKQKVREARKILREDLIKAEDGVDCAKAFDEFDRRLGL